MDQKSILDSIHPSLKNFIEKNSVSIKQVSYEDFKQVYGEGHQVRGEFIYPDFSIHVLDLLGEDELNETVAHELAHWQQYRQGRTQSLIGTYQLEYEADLTAIKIGRKLQFRADFQPWIGLVYFTEKKKREMRRLATTYAQTLLNAC